MRHKDKCFMSFQEDIIPIVTDVMTMLREQLRREAAAQGHKLSGKLAESIEFEVSPDGGNVIGRMFAEDYSSYLEFGVRADRIPFSVKTGAGGTSLYIQGLISFWELRGLSGREAISAAFATAHVHAREGMPSRASYRYSSTGERTGFIRTVIDRNADDIEAIIEDKYGARLALNFAQSLGQYENIKFSA